ncbi:MAG: 4-hydroxyphenylacetate 3-hydroxylase C-terminal domain-containing protein, partial [Oscillospiraceae bacterium]
IAFSIPADAEGVFLIGRVSHYMPRAEGMNAPIGEFGDVESFSVFDNVFIPNERIFLNGETDKAGELALMFALFHRHSYTGCKPGVGDVLMGTTALVADYLGVEKQSHIKEKMAEMISVAELVFAAGIAAGVKSTTSASGTQIPNVIYANVGRRHAGHNIYHEYNLLCDVAGGLPVTIPLVGDYLSPVVGKYVREFCARREGVSDENHYRAALLAADLLTSELAIIMQVAGVHGGGSPIMEDIAIMSTYDVKAKKNLAKHLAGITE